MPMDHQDLGAVMNILFIHQNMPAQFKHVAPMLASEGHRVMFLTRTCRQLLAGVQVATYPAPPEVGEATDPYLRRFEDAVHHGRAVVRAINALREKGFVPDLVIAHPGWGEALFLKEVLPDVPLIIFAEFSYRSRGLDAGFDPEESYGLDAMCRTRARNAHLLLSLEQADAAVSPTAWQKQSHSPAFQSKIDIIFDGIDLNVVVPRPEASFTLLDGRVLRPGDPVITYVARNLEPYRGFRTFMRSIPHIQKARPDAQILIVGGNNVSYGHAPPGFPDWRSAMDAEVSYNAANVHFLGRLPYNDYLNVLAVGTAHAYLTYPFVLSWSCLEAMAMGALVVASDTGPVQEVIRDGENGILTDFFDPQMLAGKLVEALDDPQRFAHLRKAAIATVRDRYGIDRALPQWRALVARVMGGPQVQATPKPPAQPQAAPAPGNRAMRRRAAARARS
jgi:glycosyltransferase involved in cell wall biosynthesis